MKVLPIEEENRQMKKVIDAVILMRDAQVKFFKTRHKHYLRESKDLEAKVDILVGRWTKGEQAEIQFNDPKPDPEPIPRSSELISKIREFVNNHHPVEVDTNGTHFMKSSFLPELNELIRIAQKQVINQ